MAVTVHETTFDGMAALTLEGAGLHMQIVPALGGKVISLQAQATGREFLWRHPDRPLQPVPYGASFDQYDISGWDECFPSISEVTYPLDPWKGIVVPDHGELWTLPWQWRERVDGLEMWVHSVRFGYRFERVFRFAEAEADGAYGGKVTIHYKVSNATPFPLHALWSMHPFFAVTPATRVLLPTDVRMRIEISTQGRMGHFLGEIPWPIATDRHADEPVDLSVMGVPQPTTEKLFSTRLSEGWAALFHPDDEAFVAFTFDPDEVPFMGVCQIRGGWPDRGAPTYSILLEPCGGWPDRLDLALSRGAAMVVPGGGSRQWHLTLHVGRTGTALEALIGRRLDDAFAGST